MYEQLSCELMCPSARHHFKNPSLADLANVHFKRNQVNQLLARYDDAFTDLHRALYICESGGDRELVIRCKTRELHLCYLTGQQEKGMALAVEVLRQRDIDRYPMDKAQAHNSLGNIRLRRFEIEQAKTEFETALSLYHELGDELAEARVECNLANVSNVHGDNKNALRLYQHAHDIFQKHGEIYPMAHVSKAIGQVLLDIGDHEGARASLGRALQLSAQIQDYRKQASCLLDIADLDNADGRFIEALRDVERSREIAVAHGIKDPNHWACLYGRFGEIYHHLGRWDEAITALGQMVTIAEAQQFLAYEAEGYNLLGLVMIQKTNDSNGLEVIEHGLAIAREHHLNYQVFSGQMKLAEACGWLGQRARAITLYRECITLAQKIGSDTGPIIKAIERLEHEA